MELKIVQDPEIERLLHHLFLVTEPGDGDQMQNSPCHIEQYELPGYIEMELQGEDPVARYPALHAQLDVCENCRAVYEDIKELVLLEQSGDMVEPAGPAQFDFSYMQPSNLQPSQSRSALQSSAQETVERVLDGVKWHLNALGQLGLQLSEELAIGPKSINMQPAFTKSIGAEIFRVSSQDLAPDMTVTVTGSEIVHKPQHCLLAVDVEIPSRGGWPNLAGSEVVLRIDEVVVDAELTDAFGHCRFQEVNRSELSRITLRIRSL
jgi:hypothetical protein